MKKLFIWVAAVALCVSCSQEETIAPPGGEDVGTAGADANYLSIRIASANGGTRALLDDEEKVNNGEFDDSNVNDLAAAETKVNKVRFYFFDDNGNPVMVDYQNAQSYADFSPADVNPTDKEGDSGGKEYTDEDPGSASPNVEHKLAATVIIHRKKVDGRTIDLPKKVIAIINPSSDADKGIDKVVGSAPRLETVLAAINNGTVADLTGTSGFLMSNSVYNDDNGTQNATAVTENNFKSSEAEAIANPITIYVERVVAKLTMSVSESMKPEGVTDGLYDTDVELPGGTNNEHIYVKFLGWNVTKTADKSYLVKNIKGFTEWPNSYTVANDNLFKTAYEPWNYKEYYRSFWALNPTGVGFDYGSFQDPSKQNPSENVYPETGFENVNIAGGKGFTEENNFVYLPENAADPTDGKVNKEATLVIIAGQLVKSDGTAITLVEFGPNKFVDDADHTNTKTAYLSSLLEKYVKQTSEGDNTPKTYKQISAEDIDIVTAWEAEKASDTEGGRYYVHARVKKGSTWKVFTGDTWPKNGEVEDSDLADVTTEGEKTPEDIINGEFDNMPVKIWESGNTYYYFPIRHLANPYPSKKDSELSNEELTAAISTPGFYGVVRNHVYKCTINTLAGLGTPVYNPNEIIIPEKPEDLDIFLAAQINILSWRVVNNGVDLNWK